MLPDKQKHIAVLNKSLNILQNSDEVSWGYYVILGLLTVTVGLGAFVAYKYIFPTKPDLATRSELIELQLVAQNQQQMIASLTDQLGVIMSAVENNGLRTDALLQAQNLELAQALVTVQKHQELLQRSLGPEEAAALTDTLTAVSNFLFG